MNAERIVKISRDNIPVEEDLQDALKKMARLNHWLKSRNNAYKGEDEEEKNDPKRINALEEMEIMKMTTSNHMTNIIQNINSLYQMLQPLHNQTR